jgi:hypothetical protein
MKENIEAQQETHADYKKRVAWRAADLEEEDAASRCRRKTRRNQHVVRGSNWRGGY